MSKGDDTNFFCSIFFKHFCASIKRCSCGKNISIYSTVWGRQASVLDHDSPSTQSTSVHLQYLISKGILILLLR